MFVSFAIIYQPTWPPNVSFHKNVWKLNDLSHLVSLREINISLLETQRTTLAYINHVFFKKKKKKVLLTS